MKNKRTVKLLDGAPRQHETEARINISYRPTRMPAKIHLEFHGNANSGDFRYITHETALRIAWELIDAVREGQDMEVRK